MVSWPAGRAAIEFWQAAAADKRIGTAFRAICDNNAAALLNLMSR